MSLLRMPLAAAAAARPMVAARGICMSCGRIGASGTGDKVGAFTSDVQGHVQPATIPGTSMRALVKREASPGLWMQEVEMPMTGPNDVLIQIKRASLCGTDVHIYNWDAWAARTVPTPLTIGHEWGGEIVEVGSAVTGLYKGQRVTGEGHINCGFCRNCRAGWKHLCRNTLGVGVNRTGAFADFFTLPAANVFPLPEQIDHKYASIMDPLGNAVHCALAFDLVGEDVLITGAGPIGAMAAAVCQYVGARHVFVTDINDHRLGLAKACGADACINVGVEGADDLLREEMAKIGMVEGFDVALEMSGQAGAFHQLLSTLKHGGKVAVLGIPAAPIAINWDDVVFKGLHLKGIYGREMFETWYKMANMLVAGLDKDIAPILTHELPAAEFETAFDIMRSGESGKIVLNWE